MSETENNELTAGKQSKEPRSNQKLKLLYLAKILLNNTDANLNDYENAFILISHDIPFLNSVVNLIYHMDNKKLDRYVGDYDKFMEVYEMKKAQLEAAYNKQQQEI